MPITYSISGGADADKFTIDPETGVLAFKEPPDFEAIDDANGDDIYEVTITATDETGLSADHDMRVTVTDVLEGSPPEFTSAMEVSIPENTTVVITVEAIDPDDETGPPSASRRRLPLRQLLMRTENKKNVMTVTASEGR